MNLRLPAGYVEGKAAQAQAEARESFWAFRRNLRYGTMMLWGWWVELVAVELQQFYQDFVAGRRLRLALMAPPQHGKSLTAVDFIAWISGRNPDIKTIFASYSADLGERANRELQRIFQSERYKRIFRSPGSVGWDGLAMQQRADRVRWAARIISQHHGGRADHRHGTTLGRD